MHLSYKPPSSWKRLFWSEGGHRQFINLKNFRSLVVPCGVFHKGIILQGGQLKRRFYCGNPVMPEDKRVCNRSVYPCIQTVIVCTYRRSYGLYTRLDDQNTLTRQSVDTKDSPRNPLRGPITSPRVVSKGW